MDSLFHGIIFSICHLKRVSNYYQQKEITFFYSHVVSTITTIVRQIFKMNSYITTDICAIEILVKLYDCYFNEKDDARQQKSIILSSFLYSSLYWTIQMNGFLEATFNLEKLCIHKQQLMKEIVKNAKFLNNISRMSEILNGVVVLHDKALNQEYIKQKTKNSRNLS